MWQIFILFGEGIAPGDGVVQITTEGSDFDTVLAVYKGDDLLTWYWLSDDVYSTNVKVLCNLMQFQEPSTLYG